MAAKQIIASALALGLTAMIVGCEPGFMKSDRVPFDPQELSSLQTRGQDHLGNAWQVAESVRIDPADSKLLVITPGPGNVLVNGPKGKTCDLISTQQFGDCAAHVEFVVPKGSNSGVYFMGEYEIQIFDSFGKKEITFSDCGGIYARWIDEKNVEGHAANTNASRPPGEWQTLDVIFRAPRFDAAGKKVENARFDLVKLNGEVIHKNVSLNGPTRGALTGQEKATGPILLQGDHGPVAFRNIRIKTR